MCIQLAPCNFRPVKEIGRSWRNAQRNWSARIGKTKTLLLQHSRNQLMLWSWDALVGEVRFLRFGCLVKCFERNSTFMTSLIPGRRLPLRSDILWLLRKKVPESYWEDKEVMRVAVKTDYKARLLGIGNGNFPELIANGASLLNVLQHSGMTTAN